MVLNWSFPHDFVVAQPSGPSTSPLGGGRDGLQYRSALTCPNLADAVQFYVSAFGFSKVSEPVPGVVILHAGNSEICLLEKRAGSRPSSHTQETRRYERHWTPDPPQSDRCWAELRQGRGHPSRRAASDSSVRSGGGATGALRTHARYMRVTHTASDKLDYVTERLASSVSPDTSTGFDAREAWLAGSVLTLRSSGARTPGDMLS